MCLHSTPWTAVGEEGRLLVFYFTKEFPIILQVMRWLCDVQILTSVFFHFSLTQLYNGDQKPERIVEGRNTWFYDNVRNLVCKPQEVLFPLVFFASRACLLVGKRGGRRDFLCKICKTNEMTAKYFKSCIM